MSTTQFRIILWSVSSTGWRGDQKAVVFDAKDIGVEEHANDTGSAFWTLASDHPQLAEFLPLERHYEISRWSEDRDRWEFVGAGMINDYVASDTEVVYTGLDYKALLNQIHTPLPGVTLDSISPLNPNIAITDTIFNHSDGTTALDNINGTTYTATGTALYDIVNDGNISTFSISAVSNTSKSVVVDSKTATVTAPYIKLTYSIAYTGATTGTFEATPQFRVRLEASPPATSITASTPPLSTTGFVGEFSTYADGSTGTSRFVATNKEIHLFPYSSKLALETSLIGQGASTSAISAALLDSPSGTTSPNVAYSLRNGVSYYFKIYAGIYQSGTTAGGQEWKVFSSGRASTSASNLGQSTDKTIYNFVESVFNDAVVGKSSQRLRYASLAIDGSDGTTVHTAFSYGQPVLEYIADLCDLEMGARTNGDKVVFRIVKPSAGASYNGNFKLSVPVTSASLAFGALRYPENIKSYEFTPGTSRVKNDITIVSADATISGSTTSTAVVAAAASDSVGISSYGRIEMVTSSSGFADGTQANKEAQRLINNLKASNSKQVSLSVVVDGLEIWNGWDVGDSVRVTIKHGAVNIEEPFVISGCRWYGSNDGSERIELDLVQGSQFATSFMAPGTIAR